MSVFVVLMATLFNFPDQLPADEPPLKVTSGKPPRGDDGGILWGSIQSGGIANFSQQSTTYAGLDSATLDSNAMGLVTVESLLYTVEVDAGEYGHFTLYYAYDPNEDVKVVFVNMEFFIREKYSESLGQVGSDWGGGLGGSLQPIGEGAVTQEKKVVVERDGQSTVISPETNSPTAGGLCTDQYKIELLLRDLLPNTGFATPVPFGDNFFFDNQCAEFKALTYLRGKLLDGEFTLEQEGEGLIFDNGNVLGADYGEANEHVDYIKQGLLGFLAGRLEF